jgi:hypothetical protein
MNVPLHKKDIKLDRRLFLAHAVTLMASGLSVGPVIASETRRTGLVFDPIFLTPFFPPDHPEQPERLAVAWNAIKSSGLDQKMRRIPLKHISAKELRLVHTAEHINGIRNKYGQVIAQFVRAGVGGTLAA